MQNYKLSDVEKNVWDEDKTSRQNVKPVHEPGYGERWSKTRPTKTIVFWIGVGIIILTIIVGFNWGGWVTGGTAQSMVSNAVLQRMSSICVAQFNQDAGKAQKLSALKEARFNERDDYVIEQGWATMPGETEPDSKVADACAKVIVQSNR